MRSKRFWLQLGVRGDWGVLVSSDLEASSDP